MVIFSYLMIIVNDIKKEASLFPHAVAPLLSFRA
jgi:hypothetical protein